MKLSPLFAVLTITLALFLSCGKHSDPELITEIYIQGTVKDAATNKPITDAEVTLSFEGKTLQKTKTNGKGAFSFPVSQDGNYKLFVQATGYKDAEKSFPLTNLSNNDVDIKMTLANSLTITNESSYDIENVKWSNGNANFGSIKIAGSVEVPVDTGSGYVFFTRSKDKLDVHTEYVSVNQGERKKYIIADTTIVVEIGYGDNKKTLSIIKTANPSSSSVAKSSNSVAVPSSSSKPSSSSSAPPSSSSVVPSSSSAVVSSSSVVIPSSSSSSHQISSSSVVLSSSSAVVPSSSSKPSSSSSVPPSSSSVAKSSSSAVVSSSSSKPSSSSSLIPSSSSVGCTASNNTSTHYCSNGTMKQYGSVTYEGQTYKTVVIGTQTWMAENLNFKASGSVCYGDKTGGDSQGNCAIYGRLYNWAMAMALPDSCNSKICSGLINAKHKGICPSGWHIPSNVDWNILMKFVNPSCSDNSECDEAGTKLKAKDGWNTGSGYKAGTDNYGFSALPGGYGDYFDGGFNLAGNYGFWWCASESVSGAWFRVMYYDNEEASYIGYGKSYLRSVRCVQD